MESETTIRIFIVEDHPIVRHGYDLLLGTEDDLEICGFASREQDAIDGIRRQNPDVAIIDLMLDDGGSGLELVEQLAKQMPAVNVLVISASDEELYAPRAVASGALGFLSKESASESLISAVRDVAAGRIVLSPQIMNRVIKARLGRADSVSGLEQLTNRELQVFQRLGSGDSRRDIAEKLFISPRTVERHCENIKQKLSLSSSRDLLRQATLWCKTNR